MCRSDDEALACKIAEVNRILKDCCTRKSWGFVHHSNISTSNHLNRCGFHLNKAGTSRLARNFINYLRLGPDCMASFSPSCWDYMKNFSPG